MIILKKNKTACDWKRKRIPDCEGEEFVRKMKLKNILGCPWIGKHCLLGKFNQFFRFRFKLIFNKKGLKKSSPTYVVAEILTISHAPI